MRGSTLKLVTTRSDYLSISGIQAYSAQATRRGGKPRMSGGFKMRRGRTMTRSTSWSWSFRTTNTRVSFQGARQSSPYAGNRFPPNNAFSNGSKFTHTNRGVGMWWSARFRGGAKWIWQVRVLNRRDCCGNRLSGTKVMIDNQVCGQVENGTRNGQWYTVKCSKPMRGSTLKLVTTRSDYLSISGIQAFSAQATRRGGKPRMSGGFKMRRGRTMTRSTSWSWSFRTTNTRVSFKGAR
jgi:hypothetical protein